MYLTAQLRGTTKLMQLSPEREAEPDPDPVLCSLQSPAPSLGRKYSQEVTADCGGYQHGDDHPATAEREKQRGRTGPEKELPVPADAIRRQSVRIV